MADSVNDIRAKTSATYEPVPGIVVQQSAEATSIFSGYVTSTGTITQGSGFTVTHSGTGTYDISFVSAVAGFSASIIDTAPSSLTIVVSPTSRTLWRVSCLNSGAAFDREFSFVAF